MDQRSSTVLPIELGGPAGRPRQSLPLWLRRQREVLLPAAARDARDARPADERDAQEGGGAHSEDGAEQRDRRDHRPARSQLPDDGEGIIGCTCCITRDKFGSTKFYIFNI